MLKILFFTVGLFLFSNSLSSQEIETDNQFLEEDLKGSISLMNSIRTIRGNKKKVNVEGSPLLFENWKKGEFMITYKSDYYKKNILLNYDCLNNELWIKQEDFEFVSSTREILKFRIFNGEDTMTFVKANINMDKLREDQFFLKLFESEEIKLYELKAKKIKYADYVNKGVISSGHENDRILNSNRLYISTDGKNYYKIKKYTKKIISKLPKNMKKRAQTYVKKNKIPRKPSDIEIKKLLNYLSEENQKRKLD